VADDSVDHGILGEEGDDLHLASASRAEHRIHFIHFADHLGPALARDGPELVLHDQERRKGPDRRSGESRKTSTRVNARAGGWEQR